MAIHDRHMKEDPYKKCNDNGAAICNKQVNK